MDIMLSKSMHSAVLKFAGYYTILKFPVPNAHNGELTVKGTINDILM